MGQQAASDRLCPLKFANARPPESIDWNCEQDHCEWWSKGRERCALVTNMMALWALIEYLKGTGTMIEPKA